MSTVALTCQGRITIPQKVRTALGLHAGTKLDLVLEQDGFKVVPLRHLVPALKGRFAGRVSRPVSLAQRNEAIATEFAARHAGLKRPDA